MLSRVTGLTFKPRRDCYDKLLGLTPPISEAYKDTGFTGGARVYGGLLSMSGVQL